MAYKKAGKRTPVTIIGGKKNEDKDAYVDPMAGMSRIEGAVPEGTKLKGAVLVNKSPLDTSKYPSELDYSTQRGASLLKKKMKKAKGK